MSDPLPSRYQELNPRALVATTWTRKRNLRSSRTQVNPILENHLEYLVVVVFENLVTKRRYQTSGWMKHRRGDAGCHLEMWVLCSILGLKEFHTQSGWPAACMVRKFKRQPATRVQGWRPMARFFKHIAQISEDAQTRKEHASKVWVYDYCWFQVSNFFNCVA